MPWKRSSRCEERHPHTVHPPERELCNLILGGKRKKISPTCYLHLQKRERERVGWVLVIWWLRGGEEGDRNRNKINILSRSAAL